MFYFLINKLNFCFGNYSWQETIQGQKLHEETEIWYQKISNKKETKGRSSRESPKVSTTPLQQWGFRQCLPFSWTTQRGKYCQHPIAIMGVVGTFRHCTLKAWGQKKPQSHFNQNTI